jgi:hypothetical protein
MNYTITVAAYNRPDYLKQVLDSLMGALSHIRWSSWQIIIGIDPGGSRQTEVEQVARQFLERQVGTMLIWPEHLGVSEAPRRLLQRAFMRGSDYNLHLEDDTVLSPDALNFVDCIQNEYPDGFACLYAPPPTRPLSTELASQYIKHDVFRVWGWACSAETYRNLVACTWNWRAIEPLGWDASLEESIYNTYYYVYSPVLSRITNIGREDGVHQTPEGWDKDFAGQTAANEEYFNFTSNWTRVERQIDVDSSR